MALPLSWHDAKPLLENMDGPLAPENWQGGLPFQYHLGGERVKAHLKIEMENGTQPYYVVEGRIRGTEFPTNGLCSATIAMPGSSAESILQAAPRP